MNLETVPTDLLVEAKFMRIIDNMFSSTPMSKADMDFIDAIDVELFSRGSQLGTQLADTL